MIGLISVLGQIVLWFMNRNAKTEQQMRDMIQIAEVFARNGVATQAMRLKAAEQRRRVAEMWEKDQTHWP